METKKRRVPTLTVILLIIFILVVAALYVYLYVMPQITGSLTKTYIVQYSEFETTKQAKAIVVRDEEVVNAENTGKLSYYSAETEKTRKGFTVADIYSGGKKYSLNCKSTGFVSYYIDGYEEIFNPDTLGSLDLEQYWDLTVVPENSVKDEVKIGEPVYKLVKSNTWYVLLLVFDEEIGAYKLNSSVSVVIDGVKIPGTVIRYLGDEAKRGVVISTKRYCDSFAKLRCMDLTVVTNETPGLIVPKTAVSEQIKPADENTSESAIQGVYVLGVDDEYTWKEIDILTENEDSYIVSEGKNLKLYDEILRVAK